MARFDWYQATVPADVVPVRACLATLSDHGWERMKRTPQGYGFGDVLSDADGALVRLLWGGKHEYPHVIASGEPAHAVSEVLRTHFPDHRPSRLDVCTDYAEPGAYDRLQGLALEVAKERSITVGTAGDHLLTLKGRTIYLGAPSSHTRLRIYDKAAELRAKYDGQFSKLAQIPAELARFECQVRPQTLEAKSIAARADPVALMGSAAWMRELVRRVDGLDLAPFQAGRAWRQSDHDRAYAAMLAQYGGTLQRVMEDAGSWDCAGLQIGHDLSERRLAKRTR